MKAVRSWMLGLLAMLTLVVMTGCSGMSSSKDGSIENATVATSSGAAGSQDGAFEVIRPGDAMVVVFSDLPPSSSLPDFRDRVKDDGTIVLPLGVKVQAAGKTPGALQEAIYNAYVPRYYKRITISVKSEERFFFVGGEVRTPARQIYATEITVLRAIDSAGGFTEFADKRRVILRRVSGKQYRVNCVKALEDHNLDLQVFPGDTIYVPKRRI